MKKRELFVFAGQSNMMGAAVYPTAHQPTSTDSYEYKHAPRQRGEACGQFVPVGYPVGEFSYQDPAAAYVEGMVDTAGRSLLGDYMANTFFCPSMASLRSEEEKSEYRFVDFSESTAQHGATLAPHLADGWETLGGRCAYAHAAKGGVPIRYYFTKEMRESFNRYLEEYNQKNDTRFEPMKPDRAAAADYFYQKSRDFFREAEEHFPTEDTSCRALVWLQGESDAKLATDVYRKAMEMLWEACRAVGFTHFFCIRVDFFGDERITNIMRAQEEFCAATEGAYMLTRVASYFPYAGREEKEWFLRTPSEEETDTRDSFFGYPNQHINEKGFRTIAAHALPNLYRVLREGKEPLLEEENLRALV